MTVYCTESFFGRAICSSSITRAGPAAPMDPLCSRWTLSHLINVCTKPTLIPPQLPTRQFLSNPVAGRLSIIMKGTTQNLRLGQPGQEDY